MVAQTTGGRYPQMRHTVLCEETGVSCTAEGADSMTPPGCVLNCPASSRLEHCCSEGDNPCGGATVADRMDLSMWVDGPTILNYVVRGAMNDCARAAIETGPSGTSIECASTLGETNVIARCRLSEDL